ncbi:MAG: right-handed parallel beta-helix repeat-containing protein [Myxococcaceae bacterium]|nr:right-handed parallel beta-helix repeat-containing protein [Myxococcaceae bacterium]
MALWKVAVACLCVSCVGVVGEIDAPNTADPLPAATATAEAPPSRETVAVEPTLVIEPVPEPLPSIYVGGPNASDMNAGTPQAPLATLQRAASLAMPGDTVRIRAGVYRETVVPARSGELGKPITFVPDGDAEVTVSGADEVTTAWSVYQGNIWQTTVQLPVNGWQDQPTTNTTLMANQVFVNGKAMVEARWPNLPDADDLIDRRNFRDAALAQWSANGTLNDPGLPNIPGGWVGGMVRTQGWYLSLTARITGHTGTQVQVPSNPAFSDAKLHKHYYLFGRLGALDVEKEWHYDGTRLYLWAPGGGQPAKVEVKRRNLAFDLSGRSFITVKGVQVFAASIVTTPASRNVTLDGIRAKYINHNATLPAGNLLYAHAGSTGIQLLGPGSIIENSTVEYGSSQGIVLGSSTTARNNLVHDIDYEGTFAAGIFPVNGTSDQKILWNTVYRVGRSSINLQNSQRVEIAYNDLYDFGMLNLDVGAIYSGGQADLTGTRIHHNWVHDSKALPEGEGIQTGLFLNSGSGPVTFDHNVMWNNSVADVYDQQNVPQRNAGSSRFYNNTFATRAMRGYSYVTYVNTPADIQRNNIYRDEIVLNWGQGTGDIQSSLLEGVNPQFVGTGMGGLQYRVASGSPAINAGTVLAGFTDGFVGSAPDIGAYEAGGVEWVPGFGHAP